MGNIRCVLFYVFIAGLFSWSTAAYSQSEIQAQLLLKELISSAEGQQITVFRTELPPGYDETHSHRHPGETFVYILSGRILNQMEHEEPRIYEAGEYFFEPAGALHSRFENADPDNPAVYIVFGIRPTGEY